MTVEIRQLPGYHVAYMRHIGPYGPPVSAYWQKFNKWAQARDLSGKGIKGAVLLGISHDDPSITPPDKCRYDACVAVPADFKPEAGVNLADIPGGKYAVLRFSGSDREIGLAALQRLPVRRPAVFRAVRRPAPKPSGRRVRVRPLRPGEAAMSIHRMIAAMLVFSLSPALARALPRPGALAFKDVPGQSIIYVVHKGPGHIALSFARLVAFYTKDATPYDVVFPQMTIQVSDSETWVAIAYTGAASGSQDVRLASLPAATMASKVCKGSYENLGAAISQAYREIAATKRYVPAGGVPLRLLYWNSPDDHRPRDLITEIQIPVIRRP
jgi:DNA gyrase inhibitor GyrI